MITRSGVVEVRFQNCLFVWMEFPAQKDNWLPERLKESCMKDAFLGAL